MKMLIQEIIILDIMNPLVIFFTYSKLFFMLIIKIKCIGPFDKNKFFEDSIHIFHSNVEEMLRQFELEFSNMNNDNDNTNVYTGNINCILYQIILLLTIFIHFSVSINVNGEEINNFHHKLTKEEYKIPRKNFLARNYFLNSKN